MCLTHTVRRGLLVLLVGFTVSSSSSFTAPVKCFSQDVLVVTRSRPVPRPESVKPIDCCLKLNRCLTPNSFIGVKLSHFRLENCEKIIFFKRRNGPKPKENRHVEELNQTMFDGSDSLYLNRPIAGLLRTNSDVPS